MAGSDRGRSQRDITNPGSQSPGRQEQSPAKRGMLGVEIARHAAELRQQHPAQIAATMAMMEAGFKEDVEKAKEVLSNKKSEIAIEAAKSAAENSRKEEMAARETDIGTTSVRMVQAGIAAEEAFYKSKEKEDKERVERELTVVDQDNRKSSAKLLRDIGDDEFNDSLNRLPAAVKNKLQESPEIAALRAMKRREEQE